MFHSRSDRLCGVFLHSSWAIVFRVEVVTHHAYSNNLTPQEKEPHKRFTAPSVLECCQAAYICLYPGG